MSTTFSTVSNDAPNVYIADRTYRLVERRLVLSSFAEAYTLPQQMSKTVRLVRHRRVDLPVTPLTEGVTPASVGITLEEVDIPVEQWGLVIQISDVAALTVKHPLLEKAIELAGLAIAETMERENAMALMAGTNVVFAGGPTKDSRDDLTALDVVTSRTVLEATTVLRDAGASEFETGLYGGAMSPQVEADIIDQDETFIGAAQFGDQRALEYAMIGRWMGVTWKRSNFLPIFKGVAAPGSGAPTAEVAQHTMSGSGGALDGYTLTVVAISKSSGYPKKISQPLTIADADATFTLTTPTSTNYVYDIYMTSGAGVSRKVASRVAANTGTTINAALYNAGIDQATPVAPANGVTTFNTFIFGRDAFARVLLDGMSVRSYVTPPGPSDSDPLAQRRKVGTKVAMKFAIIDPNFLVRIESGSGFPHKMEA